MSGIDDDLLPDAFSWMTFKFKSLRVIDNVLSSHMHSLKTEVHVKQSCTEQQLSVALEKIHFWFDHIVSSAIMFNRDNGFALDMMFDDEGRQKTGNFPMVMPEDPSEDFLAVIFQSKLNALGGGQVMFSFVEISSDTRENLSCGFAGHAEMYLPSMVEWIGERAFHAQPWWARNDGSTFDVIPGENADLSKPPQFGYDISFIEKQFLKENSEAAIIIKPEFKPRVISGGLDDNSNPEN
jgi:hypothetical protein